MQIQTAPWYYKPKAEPTRRPLGEKDVGNPVKPALIPYNTIRQYFNISGTASGYQHSITQAVSCDTTNCIYYWRCGKPNCKDFPNCKYVGMTTHSFKDRLSEHRDYPKRDVVTKPFSAQFTQPGHNVSHLKGVVLEKVRNEDPFIFKSREHLLIKKFDTFRNGLNHEQ